MAARLAGRNLALLLGLGAVWGTAFMFISLGLPRFSPVFFAALRFDIAGAALLAIALARGRALLPRGRAQWVALLVAAALNVGGYHALLFWGQRFTTSAVAAVIVAMNPLLTTVAVHAILPDERVTWTEAAGLGVGFAGVTALAALKPGSLSAYLLGGVGVGELAVLGAVACWSLGSTIVRRTRHGMDLFAFTAWQMLVGAVFLHLAAIALEGGGTARWDVAGSVSLLYLALASSSLGFLVFFTLLERVGPVRATMVSHVAPVFAALAGYLVLREPFEPRALLAFALIAGGFFLAARPALRSAPRA